MQFFSFASSKIPFNNVNQLKTRLTEILLMVNLLKMSISLSE